MKIYTRTGDQGETGLFGGIRVKKTDPRVEASGTIDELNAQLGVARALDLPEQLDPILIRLQNELFTLGAEIACAPEAVSKLRLRLIEEEDIAQLEADIDENEGHLPELKQFILPAGSPSGAALHAARTVCRRAERRCEALPTLRRALAIYLNRMSDLLFVLARRASHLAETKETPWSGRVAQ